MKPWRLTMYGKAQDEILERIQFAVDLGIDTVIFDCDANHSGFVSTFLPPLVASAEKLGVRINHARVCFAPPHLWVMNETISEAITFLAERKRLF